jgi:hypothetical protein
MYGEMLVAREALAALVQYEFSPEVAIKLARLGRVVQEYYADYDKVRDRLEKLHAKRDGEGNMIQTVRVIVTDEGDTKEVPVPNTFQVVDGVKWASDVEKLLSATVEFDSGLVVTQDDLRSVRVANGSESLQPWVVAGLGPFYDWPSTANGHADESVADNLWEMLYPSDEMAEA